MFVTEEQRLGVSFDVARARLASFVRDASVVSAARQAYCARATGLGESPVVAPRLVRVAVRDLVTRGSTAVLVLRWEAAEPCGTVFPVLDADLSLAPSGRDASTLTLNGAWRPTAGLGQDGVGHDRAGSDRAQVQRAATATIHGFVSLVADGIAGQEGGPAGR